MGYIYKITNKINNKIYIGLTTLTPEERWKSHILTAYNKNSKDYDEIFKKAIRKYGKENFSIKTIEQCNSLEELKEREKFWIEQYNSYAFDINSNGYNMTRGGDSPTHENNLIPVKRVNILTGEIVEHFPSVAMAERQYHRGIREILSGKNTQIPKGFTWLRENEEYNQKEQFLKHNIICRLDLQGNLLDYWLNSQQAAEINHLGSAGNINSCLTNTRDMANGYQWCYFKNLSQKKNKPYTYKGNIKRQKQVAQYDLCDNLIKIWDSASIAAKETGTLISKISAACHGRQKTSNGYKWKYI